MLISLSTQRNPVGIRNCPATVCCGAFVVPASPDVCRQRARLIRTGCRDVRASRLGSVDAAGSACPTGTRALRPARPPRRPVSRARESTT
ncbi:Hypothetical protein SCLAV_4090 [Streptomyces clavuligerus]|uniref:Uncharacterized protein n=1 Tax=Streptomyces clavuligerus TaxID=1901 RepID=B5GQC1_STRCL|nr:redoxin [Streptomyces clavuligerus]EFG09165.1 Hypothetical protein SCLAV_4090 [Streptomyces clavuligerus]